MNINSEKEIDSIVIFLHIPKTGGCTLRQIINRQNQYNYFDLRKLGATTIEERKKIKIATGHRFFGVHKEFPQIKFTYITLLRNPVERVISLFYFLSSGNHRIKIREWFRNITLADFVTNEECDYFESLDWVCSTANLQTRMISGKVEADLEMAKNNLKNYFSVVGITERFDESLKVFQKKLGWKINGYSKENVTSNKPALAEIPAEIIEIIKSKNKKDLVLYQFANQLLDEELKSI
jgi:hypothetical protein